MDTDRRRRAIVQGLLARHTEEHRDIDDSAALDFFLAASRTVRGRRIEKKKRGGSWPCRRPNLPRDHQAGHAQLFADYFASDSIYPPSLFRRRYRMSKPLFIRIMEAATASDEYFRLRQDATGKWGLSPHQKITAALRQLCYGLCADATDEYNRIGESTATESMKRLARVVVDTFGDEYLRQPTPADLHRHVAINTARGFPGMFGSLDCTHRVWKNCPVAWQGMYQDRDGDRSAIMEAVATKDLCIWHCFAGVPGSNNDINVLDRSTLIVDWLRGEASKYEFTVNGRRYNSSYLLCDGRNISAWLFVRRHDTIFLFLFLATRHRLDGLVLARTEELRHRRIQPIQQNSKQSHHVGLLELGRSLFTCPWESYSRSCHQLQTATVVGFFFCNGFCVLGSYGPFRGLWGRRVASFAWPFASDGLRVLCLCRESVHKCFPFWMVLEHSPAMQVLVRLTVLHTFRHVCPLVQLHGALNLVFVTGARDGELARSRIRSTKLVSIVLNGTPLCLE